MKYWKTFESEYLTRAENLLKAIDASKTAKNSDERSKIWSKWLSKNSWIRNIKDQEAYVANLTEIGRIKRAYDGNPQMDKDGDGIITKGDFSVWIKEKDPISQTSLLTKVTPEEYYKDYEKISTVETTIVENSAEITEGKDKGKYKTTYITPKGEEESIVTNNPIEQKKIGNSVYFKDGSDFYEISAKTGELSAKKSIDGVYDTEWKDLEGMVAEGKHLSQKQLELAENVYQLKQSRLSDNLEKAQIEEGLFSNAKSDVVKKKQTDLKNEYFTKILLPEEKKYLEEEYKAKKQEIVELEESLLDSDATPEQLAERRKSLESKKESFKDYRVEANKTYKTYKSLENVGKPVKNLQGKTMHIQGLKDEDYDNIHSLIDNRKPNIPVDSEGFEELKTKTRPEDYDRVVRSSSSNQTVVTPETKKPTANEIDGEQFLTEEDIVDDPSLAEAIDEETLLKRNKMDEETIALLKSQTPQEDAAVEEGVNWNNITGNIMDVGRGMIGLAGATEEVPEHETDPMMLEYLKDAKYRKEEGLTPQEESIMNQKVEKAHAYDVANIRGLTGGSGGTALANLGRAAGTMQEGYQNVALADASARRQTRARFDQAAGTAESLNRQKFQDKFQQVMMNKKEGAALARDSFKNLSERAQYEETYGRDSEYSKLMQAKRGALEESTAASKSSREFQRQEAINSLQEGIDARNKRIKKGSNIG